jgi:hypothetical protein
MLVVCRGMGGKTEGEGSWSDETALCGSGVQEEEEWGVVRIKCLWSSGVV